MYEDVYLEAKKQIENKKELTIKEYDLINLKLKAKEEETKDKFIYFSNKICDIMFSNINLFEEYKKSDYLNNLEHSDKIKITMKKYLLNFDHDKLLSFADKIKDFKFNEDLNKIIFSEAKKNRELFVKNFLDSKKAKILEILGKIKKKFEDVFDKQDFDIINYGNKINSKIIDFKIENKEIEEINNLVNQIMIKKFKEIINQEIEDMN